MARLSFQNVPTSTGGVVSGNISTGAGSPFGVGGKYENKIAGIKAEIAKKPKGYYDPQESFTNQSYSIDDILSKQIHTWQKLPNGTSGYYFDSELAIGLQKSYGDSPSGRNKDQYKARLDAERQRLKDVQLNAHMDSVLARLQNGEVIAPDYFQNNIAWVRSGIITPTEFLTVYQSMAKKGIIHKPIIVEKPVPVEIPTPTPSTPTPAVTSSLPIIPIIIIAVIVGIFLLRRRA